MPAALDGVRVLSFAEQYPGPYATMLMSDMGADVVLLERPDGGDPARRFPSFFEALNRGKRSVALDARSELGRSAAHALARSADVVLEGFRPGTAARLGLDYTTLARLNPCLVYASISGYGQDGPYRRLPGHDLTYQGVAGILPGDGSGSDLAPFSAVQLGDLSAGLFSVIGVLAALTRRERHGVGGYVDVSITDGLVSLLTTQLFAVANQEEPAEFLHEPGYGLFRCSDDRWLTISVAHEDRFWRNLCAELGLHDEAALTATERIQSAQRLREEVQSAIGVRSRDDWLDRLAAADVPAGPVNTLPEVLADPQVNRRDGVLTEPDVLGRRYIRNPLRISESETPSGGRRAPALGEHTAEVLIEEGWHVSAVYELVDRGVARDPSIASTTTGGVARDA